MAAMPNREVMTPAANPAAESEAGEKTSQRRASSETKAEEAPKNAPEFDLGAELVRLLGVDLRAIDGVNVLITQAVYTEVGPDLSAFPTEQHYTSWLG